MIEKLTTYPRPLPNNPMVVENVGMDNKSLFNKINELVDAANKQDKAIKLLISAIEKLATSETTLEITTIL